MPAKGSPGQLQFPILKPHMSQISRIALKSASHSSINIHCPRYAPKIDHVGYTYGNHRDENSVVVPFEGFIV